MAQLEVDDDPSGTASTGHAMAVELFGKQSDSLQQLKHKLACLELMQQVWLVSDNFIARYHMTLLTTSIIGTSVLEYNDSIQCIPIYNH
jgi:hypothetical protein